MTKLTRPEKSWILYDVANSAFTMLVSTTIPIFFNGLVQQAGFSADRATALWGTITSVAVLILALLSPILGALADYRGMKKKMFVLSLGIGLLGLLSLCITTQWQAFMYLFVITRIGYSAANIFYDSMLTDVTDDARMDMVSSHGYAWGYIGSCIPFVLGIVLILFNESFGLPVILATQISFLITFFWWGLMSLPMLKNVKQTHYLEDRKDKVKDAFRRLGQTFKKIAADKKLLFYILGYFCYIDGVYTIISMATTYGAEVGIESNTLIIALLVTQFVAFPCALLSGKLAGKYGTEKLIRVFIIAYMAICLFGFQLDKAWEFWVLAIAVGTCQGGIQALSRSHFGKLIPKEESNEYFGFFDIFGKFADFLGPMIIAFCAFVFHTSTYGVLALVVLFIAGYIFFHLSCKQKAQ